MRFGIKNILWMTLFFALFLFFVQLAGLDLEMFVSGALGWEGPSKGYSPYSYIAGEFVFQAAMVTGAVVSFILFIAAATDDVNSKGPPK